MQAKIEFKTDSIDVNKEWFLSRIKKLLKSAS